MQDDQLILLKQIFEHMQTGLSIFHLVDRDDASSMTWVFANSIAEQLLNVSFEDYKDQPISQMFPAMVQSGRLEAYAEVARSGQPIDLGKVRSPATPYTASRVYEVKAFPLPEQRVGVIFNDCTETIQAEEQTRLNTNRLKILNEASQTFAAAASNYEDLLQTVAERVATLIKDACLIRLLSDDGEYLDPVAYYDPDPKAYHFVQEIIGLHRLRTDEQITGQVFQSGDSVLLTDLSPAKMRPLVKPEFYPVLDEVGARSMIIVPLRVQNESIGLLYLSRHNQKLPDLNEHDQLLVQDLADRAAIIIHNARLYQHNQRIAVLEEQNRIARELHDAVEQTLFAASVIAESLPRLKTVDEARAWANIDHLLRLNRGALAEMRNLLLELRPQSIPGSTMETLLAQLVVAAMGRSRMQIDLAITGEAVPPPSVQVAFYRMTQAALDVIVRRANVDYANVEYHADPDAFMLVIQDGHIFAPPTSVSEASLARIRRCAEEIGAQLEMADHGDQGTRLTVRWQPDRETPPQSASR